jgi:hypothetical protein
MNTMLIWLLISIGSEGSYIAPTTTTVERFATAEECQRVAKIIRDSYKPEAARNAHPRLRCVQATVIAK